MRWIASVSVEAGPFHVRTGAVSTDRDPGDSIEHMSELPPDPPRLRVILAHLNQQLTANETVGIYLRLQRDAVQNALARAEGGGQSGRRGGARGAR